MDARGNIYSALDKDIPNEDKARLDGFLKAREEMGLLNDIKEAAFEAKIREMEAELARLRSEVPDTKEPT